MSKKISFSALLCLILAVVACQSDKSDNTLLLNRIPADADCVLVIDLKRVAESAGGELGRDRLTVPAYLTGHFGIDSANCAEAVKHLAESGISAEQIAAWKKHNDDNSFVTVSLYDAEKFEKALTENGYKNVGTEKDFRFFSKSDAGNSQYANCAFTAGEAYFYSCEDNIADVAQYIVGCAAKPMSQTAYGRYVENATGAGLIVNGDFFVKSSEFGGVLDLLAGKHLCIKVDIESEDVEGRCAVLDANGEKTSVFPSMISFDSTAVISSDATAYVSPAEALVYAAALKNVDWDAAFEAVGKQAGLDPMQMMVMGMVKEYLKKIDGTVIVGVGFDGTADDMAKLGDDMTSLNYVPATIVIQTASGQARGFLGDIKALLATAGMSPSGPDDNFSAHIPAAGTTMYAKAEDNTIILSTRPIERFDSNQAAKSLEGLFAGMGVYVPADSPLARDLGVKGNMTAFLASDLADNEGEFEIKVTDTTGGALERILRYVIAVDNAVRKFQEKQAVESNFTPFVAE